MIVAYKQPTCIVPKITEEEQKRYDETMVERRNRVLVDKFNIEITTGLSQCLCKGTWLNDEVMNYYTEMINQRNNNKHIYCFSSFLWAKLEIKPFNYKRNVERWSKRAEIKLMELKQLYFTMHVGENHWTVMCINVEQKKFQYYDSRNHEGVAQPKQDQERLNILRKYVTNEAKKYSHLDDYECDWELKNEPCPEQTDGCSCGVFALRNIDLLSAGCPLNYTQDDMDDFRVRIFTDIMNKRLITQ